MLSVKEARLPFHSFLFSCPSPPHTYTQRSLGGPLGAHPGPAEWRSALRKISSRFLFSLRLSKCYPRMQKCISPSKCPRERGYDWVGLGTLPLYYSSLLEIFLHYQAQATQSHHQEISKRVSPQSQLKERETQPKLTPQPSFPLQASGDPRALHKPVQLASTWHLHDHHLHLL